MNSSTSSSVRGEICFYKNYRIIVNSVVIVYIVSTVLYSQSVHYTVHYNNIIIASSTNLQLYILRYC